MNTLIQTSEFGIRLGCFLGVLFVMAAWELVVPRRLLTGSKAIRWSSNLGLVLLNGMVLRLLVPMGGAGVALFAQSRGWGLLNQFLLPDWLAVVISVVVLDLAIYSQHVLFHMSPLLWRLHMVHHADLDIDVTTGLRFHTLEIVLSFGIKAVVIVLLGASPTAVLIFEVLLNGTAMFNHSNVKLPLWIDRVLRLVLVTPDMHRVHHSTIPCETDSNYGFNLPWWDFLFRTYRDQPARGHLEMTIGLEQFQDDPQKTRASRLWWMLLLPWIGTGNEKEETQRGKAPTK